MKQAMLMVIFISFFSLAFLPGDASSQCANSLLPPFIATGVAPNVLIILDNSNSFDEDFYGNAVGSYSPVSKSVVARQALQSLVQNLQDTANVGLMTFTLPSNTSSSWYIHNAMPFASYDPASYCANPPPDCVTYCTTGNAVSQSNCEAACPGLTSTQYKVCCTSSGTLFTSGFPDFLLSLPPNGPYAFNEPTGTRARYCGLAYPKTTTMALTDKSGGSVNLYWNVPDPFYDTSNDGIQFGYTGSDQPNSSAYSPAENATNLYAYYYNKLNYNQYSNEVMSDLGNNSNSGKGYSTYDTSYEFEPTDSDWALGFFNWGQRMPWYYVGQTWFSDSAPGSPQGYLHVAVGPLTNSTQYNNIYNILNPNSNNSAGYMSCTASNANACSYIVNAGNTPTAGALTAALNYLNGNYTGFCFNSSGMSNGTACTKNSNCNSSYPNCSVPSPITSSCQQNFIILVTDGLPDTLLNGTQTITTSTVMPQVINVLQELANTPPSPVPSGWTNVTQKINGTTYTFPVLTYVLGIGSEAPAGPNLDSMAVAGGTAVNGHAYYASDADQLITALNAIASNLLQRVAAGSSVSILSQGQTQNGSNMLQAVFYPSRYFGSTLTLTYWPGYLYNYWFYNGATYNNMREDTLHDFILELNEDDGISFDFNPQTGLSVNRYSDPTGSGNPSVFVNNEGLDSLIPLWEAGKLLFQTAASSRVIYTPGSSASGLVSFNTSNATLTSTTSSPLGSPSNFTSCLQGSSSTATLQNLINYVSGVDLTGCRSRTVGLCSNGTSFSSTPCASNSDCTTSPYTTCTQNVWKLGDIVYSTPQVQTGYNYCSNGSSFNSQVCSQNSDCTSSTYNSCQPEESVVFVGANDGMLHAFQTGILTTQGMNPSQYQVEALTGIPTSSMGTELWGFIPQNALPYLRCLAVPPPSNCHLYYNDLSPYITQMNSNGVSKKVLIGGMRLGGGSVTGPAANYCFSSAGVSNGQTCTSVSKCTTAPYTASCSSAYPTNVPADTCSGGYVTCSNPATCYSPPSCTGLSSYYALDITDAYNPKLLWEFSHPLLGYTYSGPAVIHKWSNPSTLTGDQYYVLFLSGPTKPTDGSSIQDVQVFVLTLNANLGISSVYYNDLGSTTKNGFGGRLLTNGLDVNGDGYTDFVLFGYSNSPTGSATGWQGGIGKINTNNSNATSALSPQSWTYDVTTYSNIAQLPITAKITAEQCFGTWYLYAGTGRYFFPLDNYDGTYNSGLNYLMGIPFTCDQYNNNCTGITSLNNSATACTGLQSGSFTQAGWQYTLNAASGSFLDERLITDPTTSTNNTVYMVTSEPTSDPCSYGGQSRVWGLNCATGAAITDTSCSGFTVTNLTGTLYLQTSTGAVYQIDAATSFTGSGTNNRTTAWYVGMPPETAAPVVQPPASTAQSGQLIQWIER